MWITAILVLCLCTTGVHADEKTAVIAAGCVAGFLLLIAVICGVYCLVRNERRKEKKPLPRSLNGGPPHMYLNGGPPSYRNSYRGPPNSSEVRMAPSSPRPKAYTQHAISPRQRPPITFYTVRTDPRGMSEVPGAIPLGPAHPYRGPPTVGRPVIFLNWNGSTERPSGFHRDFMYQNSGTMLYYANGGAYIEELDSLNDAGYRTKGRDSRHKDKTRSRSRSKSKSRSRSRDPDKRSKRRYSNEDETPILANPGDVILQTQNEDISYFARNSNRKSHRNDDNNNIDIFSNQGANIQDTQFNNTQFVNTEHRYADEDGRYSVTQIKAHASAYPTPSSGSYGRQTILQEREKTMTFTEEDDLEPNPEPTPRIDYDREPPRSNFGFSQTSQATTENERPFSIPLPNDLGVPEPTPRADYAMTPQEANGQTENEAFKFASNDIDDILALSGPTTSHSTRSAVVEDEGDGFVSTYRQDPSLDRPPSPPDRPPTPPFDGVSPRDDVYPHRMSVFHEEDTTDVNTTTRVPTPPPDMTLDDEEESPLDRLDNLARVPTPPPLPSNFGNLKARPPTPPKGKDKDDKMDIDDILGLGQDASTSGEPQRKKSLSGSQGREGGLPFMEELRRRQKSIDEGIPTRQLVTPPSPPADPEASFLQSGNRDSDSDDSGHLGAQYHYSSRRSLVQFADDPPEVIPRAEEAPESPDSDEAPISFNVGTPPAPPPAPPPPPPPPPPPMP